jgi:hypothetical protein
MKEPTAINRWHTRGKGYVITHECKELGITRGQRATWGPTGKPCTFVAHCENVSNGDQWYSFFTEDNRHMGHATRVYWVYVDATHGERILHAEP